MNENTIVNERVTTEMANQSKELEENFEKFYERVKDHLDNTPIKEAFRAFYYQGHVDNTAKGVELTKDEWETECFLNFVKGCIANPEIPVPRRLQATDYIKVSFPCEGHLNCQNWSDRCEDVGGDGITCSRFLNINKLCGLEGSKKVKNKAGGKYLTKEEIDQLSEILLKND